MICGVTRKFNYSFETFNTCTCNGFLFIWCTLDGFITAMKSFKYKKTKTKLNYWNARSFTRMIFFHVMYMLSIFCKMIKINLLYSFSIIVQTLQSNFQSEEISYNLSFNDKKGMVRFTLKQKLMIIVHTLNGEFNSINFIVVSR